MNAADIMVTDVITISPDTSVAEAAALLLKHRISGIPVVENGVLVGILSEGDLLRRVESRTERRRSWWLEMFTGTDTLAAEYVKSHSKSVRDVMTADVISAPDTASLAEVADLLERHHIKRIPIVRNGNMVGLVSRANLLQALASLRAGVEAPTSDDRAIRDEILRRIKAAPWGVAWGINVTVKGGVVDLWGGVTSEEQKSAMRVAAETVPGVRQVNSNLFVQHFQSGV